MSYKYPIFYSTRIISQKTTPLPSSVQNVFSVENLKLSSGDLLIIVHSSDVVETADGELEGRIVGRTGGGIKGVKTLFKQQ
jgi:hypothetical protein